MSALPPKAGIFGRYEKGLLLTQSGHLGTSWTVDILVSRVRKKLDKTAVLTVPHIGYKCGWPVSGVEDAKK